MKDKIVQLMKSEGLSSSRLAEILEIQPSGVSHLVSGRNKPGFDLLQKILRRFPDINPYWLMLDDEVMYRPKVVESSGSMESVSGHTTASSLRPISNSMESMQPELSVESPVGCVAAIGVESVVDSPIKTTVIQPEIKSSKIDLSKPNLKRVILLYDDDTCETYEVK